MFKFNQSDINHYDVYSSILIKLTLQYNLNIDVYKYLRKIVDIEINYKRNITELEIVLNKYLLNESQMSEYASYNPLRNNLNNIHIINGIIRRIDLLHLPKYYIGGVLGEHHVRVINTGVRMWDFDEIPFLKFNIVKNDIDIYCKETNIEKTGYLSYGGTLTENFTTNSNKKAPYLEIGNYNSTDNSLTINKFNNFTTYKCKDKCDDNKNCGGFYISNRKVCELKNDNIKQNIYRKENTDGLLYIKSNPPNENSKYNNKITDTTGVQWDKYNLDNDSDIKKLTELGMITKEEIGDLLRARNQLAQSNNKFKDSINKLAIEDAEISLETKEDIKNFRNNLKDYKTFDKKSNEIKSKLNNLDAMKLDSELQLIQDNKQYLMWTIATILVVIGSMKIVKQN